MIINIGGHNQKGRDCFGPSGLLKPNHELKSRNCIHVLVIGGRRGENDRYQATVNTDLAIVQSYSSIEPSKLIFEGRNKPLQDLE